MRKPAYKANEDGRGVAHRIKAMRVRAGLTQEQLAKAAGISTRSLKRYESAERDVSLSVLKRIERELDARISDVRPLGDSEDSAADGVVLDPAEGDAVELTRQLRTAIDTLSEQGQHVLLALALTILRQEGTRNP